MKLKLVPLVLASATLISGCLEENKAPAVSKEDAIASVNGTYISKKTLETLEKEIADRSQAKNFLKSNWLMS